MHFSQCESNHWVLRQERVWYLLHHEKAPEYGTICEGNGKVEKQRYVFVGKGEYNVVTIQNFPTVYVLNISPFPLDLDWF